MREVITPGLARFQAQQADQFERAIEENRVRQGERRANVDRALAEALEPLPERTRRIIRMHVALRAPQKPMSPDELQMWLDEHVIGVAKYMLTSRIV